MRYAHPFALAAWLALALAAALNLLAVMPPLQDFNEWIYQGWLVGEILRGAEVPFAIKPWPVPNAAAQALLGVLNLALQAHGAGLAYLTLYLAGFAWLAWRLAHRQGGFEPATFLLIMLVGVLNSPYWDGYANYQLGLALLLLHVFWQRRGTGAWTDLAMGIAIFFCHAVVLAVFALLVGWRALLQRHLLRGALVLAPPLAMLGWYVMADDNYGEYIPPFGNTLREFVAYKAYTLAKSGPYQNMVIGGIGDAARAPWLYYAGVAANLAFVLAAMVPLALAVAWDAWRGGRRSPEVLTALCCLAGFAVLPSAMFGVVNIGERLLLPGVLIALAACTDPWRLRRFGAAVAMLAPAAVLHFHLVIPPVPPAGEIRHLAAHDPAQRYALLFWHRPFQFRDQIAAARRGEAVGLGFTTSLLRPACCGQPAAANLLRREAPVAR